MYIKTNMNITFIFISRSQDDFFSSMLINQNIHFLFHSLPSFVNKLTSTIPES